MMGFRHTKATIKFYTMLNGSRELYGGLKMFEHRYKQLGDKVCLYRQSRGLTQSELAKLASVSRPRISYIECGKGTFNIEILFLIAQAINVEPSILLEFR